jgi:hypothetical protein
MSNTLFWSPSDDPHTTSYGLQSSSYQVGPWVDLASVPHVVGGDDYLAGPPAQFFFVDASGTLGTWYRLRAVDDAGLASDWSYPFQVGETTDSASTSVLEVVQMALGCIGDTGVVTSITSPQTKAERFAALHYSRTRDTILRKVSPSWATRRGALVQLTDSVRDGWGYVYMAPPDMLRVLAFDLGYRGSVKPTDVRWAIEANNLGSGWVLTSDFAPPASVAYVAQITDPSVWTPDFLEAVVWGLAAKLALPMGVPTEKASTAFSMARLRLNEAIADDANDGRTDPPPDSEIITARSW